MISWIRFSLKSPSHNRINRKQIWQRCKIKKKMPHESNDRKRNAAKKKCRRRTKKAREENMLWKWERVPIYTMNITIKSTIFNLLGFLHLSSSCGCPSCTLNFASIHVLFQPNANVIEFAFDLTSQSQFWKHLELDLFTSLQLARFIKKILNIHRILPNSTCLSVVVHCIACVWSELCVRVCWCVCECIVCYSFYGTLGQHICPTAVYCIPLSTPPKCKTIRNSRNVTPSSPTILHLLRPNHTKRRRERERERDREIWYCDASSQFAAAQQPPPYCLRVAPHRPKTVFATSQKVIWSHSPASWWV